MILLPMRIPGISDSAVAIPMTMITPKIAHFESVMILRAVITHRCCLGFVYLTICISDGLVIRS